jgi:hypothetical protein
MSGYSIALFEQHAALLADSAIPPELASRRGYVSVDTKTRLAEVGIVKSRRSVPGLLIPLLNADESGWGWQYRPDDPAVPRGGLPRKYETPWQQSNSLDVPPGVGPLLDDPAVPLWVTEGSRKGDAAAALGLPCIALLGVDAWLSQGVAVPAWRDVRLRDRRVVVAYDSDVMHKADVRGALTRLAGWLAHKGAAVEYLWLPHGVGKVGLDDYIAGGHGVDDLWALVRPDLPPVAEQLETPEGTGPDSGPLPRTAAGPAPKPHSLTETVNVFKKWLHLDDPAPVYALAATIVANRAPGDPVWLLIVSAPSTGKTELLSAAAGLPYVCSVATLTASALLSGTSKRERTKDATGGVLRQVGDFGILLCKDFTSVLAQNRDTRAEALAALREVYDGRWDRAVGTDGGRVLTWRGKCGLLGGVTPAFDGYNAVVSTLGDRFLLLRLPDVDPAKTGAMALSHRGRETQMRGALADALAGLVEHADLSAVNRALTEDETRRLVRLATFTARGRTGVARDGYRRDVVYLPQVEGPGRLVLAYARLLGGLGAIGCDGPAAWKVLGRVAVDCMPATRARLARVLLDMPAVDLLDPRPGPIRTSEAAAQVGMATSTAREHLDDLALLAMADRTKTSDADNAHDRWSASDWLREFWPKVEERCTYPPPTPEGGGSPDASAERAPLRTSLLHSEPSPNGQRPRCTGCRRLVPDGYTDRCPSCQARAEAPA